MSEEINRIDLFTTPVWCIKGEVPKGAYEWALNVEKNVKQIWKREKLPIVVGGTGLYFKALTDGLSKIPNIPNSVRNSTRKLHKKIGQNNFFKINTPILI